MADSQGSSSYRVDYAYPRQVVTDSNFTIRTVLEISALTGLRLFLSEYRIDIFISSPGKLIAHGVNISGGRYLYEGAHWGPRIIVIPINASAAGIRPGQELVANVSIGFLATVWYDSPLSYFYPESGTKVVGAIMILNPDRSNTTYLILLFVVAVVAISVAYLERKRHFVRKELQGKTTSGPKD